MANAKKLPSGSWRTLATKIVDGQRVTRSFTVSPKEFNDDWRKAKAQSELLARTWQNNVEAVRDGALTVGDAMINYIEDRRKVLSPATIHTYESFIKYFDSIKYDAVDQIETPILQRLINDMAISVSAKTIKSRIGFLLSVLDYAGNEKRFKLRYPQKKKRELTTPDPEDVFLLLSAADEIMKPIICLAAFGTLRRGEIAGLKWKDLSRDMNLIMVSGDMVIAPGNTFVYKEIPKTSDSARSVELPSFVFDLLPPDGDPDDFVFDISPTAITRRFERLRNKLGFSVRFHDLRHFAASFRSDLGIPPKYIEEVGGWASDSKILQSTYDNALNSSRKKYTAIANKYVEDTFKKAVKSS